MRCEALVLLSFIALYPSTATAQENQEDAPLSGDQTPEPPGTPPLKPESLVNTVSSEVASDSDNTRKTASKEASTESPETSAGKTPPARPAPPEGGLLKKKRADLTESSDSGREARAVMPEKKKKKKKVEVKTRVHIRWQMESVDESDDIENRFLVRRARLKLIWKPEKWLTAKLQVGEFHDVEFGASMLKDAYVHLSPSRYLELRVGQFKKPFSGLELRSSGKLRVAERGEGNSVIIEDLLYGGRDLGVQLSGRLVRSVKLDYIVGLFNGTGPDLRELGNAKDIVARMMTRPLEWFEAGVNGSFKFFDDDARKEDDETFSWAAGADAVFRVAGARLHLEGIIARDQLYQPRYAHLDWEFPWSEMPLMVSGLAILSYRYRFDTSWRLAVEPVFKMEIFDPNSDFMDDHVIIYNPGFNAYFGMYLRMMLHAEISRGLDNTLATFEDRETLMLQLCLDI
jgi:hypothetical protein